VETQCVFAIDHEHELHSFIYFSGKRALLLNCRREFYSSPEKQFRSVMELELNCHLSTLNIYEGLNIDILNTNVYYSK
jgi:hypothetical protein